MVLAEVGGSTNSIHSIPSGVLNALYDAALEVRGDRDVVVATIVDAVDIWGIIVHDARFWIRFLRLFDDLGKFRGYVNGK